MKPAPMIADRLYLDHAATTPICAEARAAIAEAMARWANPSSPHAEGRAARAALEDARSRVKAALGWDGELLFTSGASEAIGLALRGFPSIASAVEHDAVLAAASDPVRLPVGGDGIVRLPAIEAGVRYAIQLVNNETGIIQPLAELGDRIRADGGLLFADCAQGLGKLALPDADMLAFSGHKFGAPPGVGALLLRDLSLLMPTGGQEKGYRRGTESLPLILGMAAALEAGFGWAERATGLRTFLDAAIKASGGEIVGETSARIPTIAGYRMPGVSASSQLISFDMAGIAVSAGSACSSGTLKGSPVLAAMGWDDKAAAEVVRVSFGPTTSQNDVDRFLAAWLGIRDRVQAA
jgi:cysteine desulfurase